MRVKAHDRWVSIGAYLIEAHNSLKPEKVESPSSMVGRPDFINETGEIPKEVYEKIKPIGDGAKVDKITTKRIIPDIKNV